MYLLLTAVLAAGLGVAWAALTNATELPWPAVIGLALTAGAIAALSERAVHTARTRHRRPPHHGDARPRPDHRRNAA